MEFEWDETKAAGNLTKYGVSFEEAKTVFEDRLYVDFYDPKHSLDASLYYYWTVEAGAHFDCFVC